MLEDSDVWRYRLCFKSQTQTLESALLIFRTSEHILGVPWRFSKVGDKDRENHWVAAEVLVIYLSNAHMRIGGAAFVSRSTCKRHNAFLRRRRVRVKDSCVRRKEAFVFFKHKHQR
jgi:hypothetical protein